MPFTYHLNISVASVASPGTSARAAQGKTRELLWDTEVASTGLLGLCVVNITSGALQKHRETGSEKASHISRCRARRINSGLANHSDKGNSIQGK